MTRFQSPYYTIYGQTQSPSSTKYYNVSVSLVWEALKRKGAQRGATIKAASLSRLCCRSKINHRTSFELAENATKELESLGVHAEHFRYRSRDVAVVLHEAVEGKSPSACFPIVTRVPWQHFQLVRWAFYQFSYIKRSLY